MSELSALEANSDNDQVGPAQRKVVKSIGFIGLGHMGNPMAHNLIQAGLDVYLYDINPDSLKDCVEGGGEACESAIDAADGRDIIISMLPEGKHARQLYLGEDGILENLSKPTLIVDCSTIDIESSLILHEEAVRWGHRFLDAPVSGGVLGARKGTLTFMVGGEEEDFNQAKPVLQKMGKNIFHAGMATHGLVAKICNNLMLGIHMVGTCEAFILADRLGLAKEKLFEIASASSGQSWVLSNYCPVAGILQDVPANHDYQPGFSSSMMLKDLRLATDAAHNADISIPLTEKAEKLYDLFCQENGGLDFSAIIQYLDNQRD